MSKCIILSLLFPFSSLSIPSLQALLPLSYIPSSKCSILKHLNKEKKEWEKNGRNTLLTWSDTSYTGLGYPDMKLITKCDSLLVN
jgi:hypothetical protein